MAKVKLTFKYLQSLVDQIEAENKSLSPQQREKHERESYLLVHKAMNDLSFKDCMRTKFGIEWE